MSKLIAAVGEVIREKGYTGLTPTNIARTAGLSRRLITTYFGSADKLIETYVRSRDYWVAATGNAGELIRENQGENTMQILETLLHSQLDYFYRNEEMQKIVLWQISQSTRIMYEVCEDRERLGKAFFAITDEELAGRGIDLRAIAALLISGIYYLVLHAHSTDSLFCDVDLNSAEGMQRVKNVISFLIEKSYAHNTDITSGLITG